uniref:IF rod domain-containing protein n=1 Tax=Caenorhabditis tropicalis TaxID=1561998 RepID=A0A1I7TTM8_9PELO
MNAEREVKEEVESEDEMPTKRSGVKRRRESTSNESRSFEPSSLMEKIYEELLDSKKCCRVLEERILNIEKKCEDQEKELLESKERNEILEERMKNIEEIRSLEERHIPITETISAACYYLEESSKIIDLYNEKNGEIEKKLVEIQNKLIEHVELNREEMKEIWLQIGVNSDEKIEELDEIIQKKFKEHVELNREEIEKLQMDTDEQMKELYEQIEKKFKEHEGREKLEKLALENKIFDSRKEFEEHIRWSKEAIELLQIQTSKGDEKLEKATTKILDKFQKHVESNQENLEKLEFQIAMDSVEQTSKYHSLEDTQNEMKEKYDKLVEDLERIDNELDELREEQEAPEIGADVEERMKMQLTRVENQMKQNNGSLNSWISSLQTQINEMNGGNTAPQSSTKTCQNKFKRLTSQFQSLRDTSRNERFHLRADVNKALDERRQLALDTRNVQYNLNELKRRFETLLDAYEENHNPSCSNEETENQETQSPHYADSPSYSRSSPECTPPVECDAMSPVSDEHSSSP